MYKLAGAAFLSFVAVTSAIGEEGAERAYAPLPEYRVFGTPSSAEDAKAIADLMQRFSIAWGDQDVDRLLTTYADDAEWVNAFGAVSRGHEELREIFTWVFERFPSEERSKTKTQADASAAQDPPPGRLSLRYMGSDAAVVHSFTESDWGESRDGSGLRRVLITYVLEKRASEWRIVHQMIMDARR